MALKAPGIVTFMLSVVLTVTILIVKYAGAEIPLLLEFPFEALLLSHVILIFGCIMRGL
jgi:hypothetical protein